MSEYTKGPWELQPGRVFVTSSGSFYITYGKDRYGNPEFRNFCELDANAHLIAAAPDLLAACEALRDATDYDDVQEVGGEPLAEAIEQARAAIRAAKGEQQ